MIRSAEVLSSAEGNTCRTVMVRVCRAPRCLRNPGTHVHPTLGLGRATICPGSRAGAAEERRESESMMNGLKQSDSAIVSVMSANKGTSVPAEPMEGWAGTKGNPCGQSMHRTQGRDRMSQAAERIRCEHNCNVDPPYTPKTDPPFGFSFGRFSYRSRHCFFSERGSWRCCRWARLRRSGTGGLSRVNRSVRLRRISGYRTIRCARFCAAVRVSMSTRGILRFSPARPHADEGGDRHFRRRGPLGDALPFAVGGRDGALSLLAVRQGVTVLHFANSKQCNRIS